MDTRQKRLQRIARNSTIDFARELTDGVAKQLGYQREACCLLDADALRFALCHSGIPALLQAGSMSWPRIRPEEDDGVINTHFSYVFEAISPATVLAIMNNRMPEMHAWVAVPPCTIIDTTTRFLKQQCEKLTDMKWTADEPPDYLWCDTDDPEFPSGVMYRPDVVAIELANVMLDNLLRR